MKRNSPFFGNSGFLQSSFRPRIALMEKDSDLSGTGTKGIGLKVCERPPGNGSIIEATERDLLHSITQVLLCYVEGK